jgi:hypothetical protein
MKHRIFPALLGCALLCSAALALARKPPAAPAPPGRPASLEQAVKQVQHATRGHILAADTVSRGKSNVYRIKVLTPQGQVRVVQMHSNPRARPRQGKPDSDRGGH